MMTCSSSFQNRLKLSAFSLGMVLGMKRLAMLFTVLLWGVSALAFAQDNPVSVRLEIYVVSATTNNDGTVTENFVPATTARPGQVVEYRLFATNNGDTTLPPGTVVILGPIPEGTAYLENSATPTSERILTEYSGDGGIDFSEPPVMVNTSSFRGVADPEQYTTVRWTLRVAMEPGAEEDFFYRVVVK